jgi:hypothetical protein
MNAIVESAPRGIVATSNRMEVSDVVQHVKVVQEVMRAVMKEGLHFGKIPGTDKPSLLQPGADVLAMTFRIAQKLTTEDLSTADAVRYRVTCSGVHQMTGLVLGEGIGECSSGEEKYKWRRSVSDAEFDATPENMRRVKFGKSYTTKQVRTEPADVANTVLKMAVKRAKIAMILNVTGASDMFGQDLEDLDEALRESLTEGERGGAQSAAREKWLADVAACKTLEALATLASGKGPAVADFQRTKDTEGYSQFVTAVKARGAAIREKQTPADAASAPAAAPAPAQATDDGTPDPEFLAAMDAAEKGAAGA